MNNDRITELYEGTFGDRALQRLGRERIHWLCSQATGVDVLDVGCSQGIASILLGREGKSVVGIDHERPAIDFARDRLKGEDVAVRRRVEFRYAEASRLPFSEDGFDIVLMGEVLEHLVQPAVPLAEARRVLRPKGKLVITIPYGLSPYGDHKEPLYLHDALGLLEADFAVDELVLLTRYLGITATPRVRLHSTNSDLWKRAAAVAEQRLAAQDEALDAQRELVRQLQNKERDRTSPERDALRQQRDALRQQREQTAQERDQIARERDTVKQERDQVERSLGETESRLATEMSMHVATKKQVAEARALAGRRTRELAELRAGRTYRVASRMWRARRALRRNRFLTAGLAAAVVVLVVGVLLMSGTIGRLAFGVTLAAVAILAVSTGVALRLRARRPRSVAVSASALDSPRTQPPDYTPGHAQHRAQPTSVGRYDDAPSHSEQDVLVATTQPRSLRSLRVAGILDDISRQCFAPECALLPIGADWRESLEAQPPDLLLVESAWSGNGGAWQYMVGSYPHPHYRGLPQLRALLAWCHEHGIPTVFWNKEDPVHFDRFKEAAVLFDHILTTDAHCLPQYQKLAGASVRSIGPLPFAAQPRLHNPIRVVDERSAAPCFAGTYYRNRHPSRRKSLEALLDAARPHGLKIYDRRLENGSDAFGFPERFRPHIVGSLPYEQLIDVYKSHSVFLNVNSVTESPTMFSRRVFELLACDAAVLSTQSLGIERMFGNLVPRVENEEDARAALDRLLNDDEYRRSLTLPARRLVLREHTYRHRTATIAAQAGLQVDAHAGRGVSALVLVDSATPPNAFASIIADLRRQSLQVDELLVGTTRNASAAAVGAEGADHGPTVRTIAQPATREVSQRWRQLAALSSSPLVAMLCPDWRYGEHHLEDLADAIGYTEADVVAAAVRDDIGASPVVEHRFTRWVHPQVALARRDLIASRGWPAAGADSRKQLESWFRQGVRFYVADAADTGPATSGADVIKTISAEAAAFRP